MEKTLAKLALLIKGGFVPILTKDSFDPLWLCQIVQESGLPAVEFTLRRDDLKKIVTVKKKFPDLILLTGSTVDNSAMVKFLKKKRLFYSLAELFGLGADGFVSMAPFQKETYRKFCRKVILVPGVSSPGEALEHLAMGAHLTKFVCVTDSYLKGMQAPLHGLIPIFYTGGVTLDRIDGLIKSGVLVCGAGFDVILGDKYNEMQKRPNKQYILEKLSQYKETVRKSRENNGEEYYYFLNGEQLLRATGRYLKCLK